MVRHCHIYLLVFTIQCTANLMAPIGGGSEATKPPAHLNLTVADTNATGSGHLTIMGAPNSTLNSTLPPATTTTTHPTFTNPVLFGATTAAPAGGMVTGPIPVASIQNASLLSLNASVAVNGTVGTGHEAGGVTTGHGAVATTPAGTTAHSAVNVTVAGTTVPPGTTAHGAVATTPSGTTAHSAVNVTVVGTTVPPGTTAHAMVNATVAGTTVPPGTTVHGAATTVPPGTTLHGAVTTVAPGTTAHAVVNATVAGTTAHVAVTTSPLGTTAHGAVTTAHAGTTVHGATTQNPYCSSDEALTLAGTCYIAMDYISGKLDTMTNGNMLDAKSIEDVNGYCDTFKTCFAVLEPCGDFTDSNAISIVNEFCAFYHFFTSKNFLSCTKLMESVEASEQKCITSVSGALLDFNATLVSRCSRAMADNACSVAEVNNYCSEMATQRYQIFVNRHLQEWNC